MMKKNLLIVPLVLLGILLAGSALAHTPLCDCYDNGDGSVTCEGGFSDGSSASGVEMSVRDGSGAVLMEGKMDENSEYTFKKPEGSYKVRFFAGEGHEIIINGEDIVE